MSFDATDYTSREIEAHIEELEECISKAKAILEPLIDRYKELQVLCGEIQRALEALEGK